MRSPRLNPFWSLFALCLAACSTFSTEITGGEIAVNTTKQVEREKGSGLFLRIHSHEKWEPAEVAIIVCDVWDSHHCLEAVRRVTQLAPRINRLVEQLRRQGVTIIHAPSDCMKQYEEHPSRVRARAAPMADDVPGDIGRWCDAIPSEESSEYPLDQSDGGEDDDPLEHAQWLVGLAAAGRKPAAPWLFQSPEIKIDPEGDFVSDSGVEVWNILAQQNIKHVLVCGVHTNMCVLGRPFGLRQLASHGKHVLLVRDLTDTMYNPSRWPFVNHFSGNDRIVDHIERYVCSTISSDALIDGTPFRFSADTRPHIAIVAAEDEYETEETLTRFSAEQLGRDFRVSLIYDSLENPNLLLGIEAVDEADLLLLSVRRRPIPETDLNRIRRFVASGKPVLGIRTASHAFLLRDNQPSGILAQWPEFDSRVLGGNYTGHFSNELRPSISFGSEVELNATFLPIRPSLDHSKGPLFESSGSLYRVRPLAPGAKIILNGTIENQPSEPVAWTFVRADGGKSFYTSLGHREDFNQLQFITLLRNAIHWAAARPQVDQLAVESQQSNYRLGHGKQR